MSKAGAKFSEVKELLMKDEEFRTEYEKLKPRYDVISQIIEVRTSQNITQEELALRVGTQKSNISRLESGSYNIDSYHDYISISCSIRKALYLSDNPTPYYGFG